LGSLLRNVLSPNNEGTEEMKCSLCCPHDSTPGLKCTCEKHPCKEEKKISKSPNSLFIQLLRYSGESKIMTPIKIEEQFNLNGTKYHVQGLILHQGGSIHHGHYVTYLKHGGSWTLHDDDKPTQSAEFQEINNRQQYIIIARKAEKDGHQFVTPSTKRRAQPLAQLESEECQLCINSTQHHCQMCKQPVCNFHSVPYDDTESHRVHPQCQTQKSLSGRSSSESLYDSECEGKRHRTQRS
jgi:hypothetical protein